MRKKWMSVLAAAVTGIGLISSIAAQGAGKETEGQGVTMEAVTEADAAAEMAAEETETPDTAAEEANLSQMHGIRYAGDYKEVYEALLRGQYGWYTNEPLVEYAMEDTAAMAGGNGASADMAAKAFDTGAAYSATNLRDPGVDEADVVKTDGEYIYVLRSNAELVIRSVSGPEAETVSVTKLQDGEENDRYISDYAADMYIDGNRLVLIASRYQDASDEPHLVSERAVVSTYDITDRAAPVLLGSVWQDGYYTQSRKVGQDIYVYTTVYPVLRDQYEDCSLVPCVNGKELEASRVAIPEVIIEPSYLLVSSVNIEEPDQTRDALALVSGGDNVYVSESSLYVMGRQYERNTERTEIVKFNCSGGLISGVGACYIKGSINDSFSIDEYNGYLRVLTTYTGSDAGAVLEAISDIFGWGYYDEDRWVRHNALYVLDENLKRVGAIRDLAENEEIRSARFFGDTAYFVTFRNTDPLFAADLSDPASPKILGELSITGFSAYLHPYGDGLLLGVGYEADPETGWNTGVKLSMFDISDPAHVTELDRYVIEGPVDVPALSDYKAILADAGKNVIGFYMDNRYLVCSYTREGGFKKEMLYDFYGDSIGATSYQTMRGLYIADELYLAGPDYLIAFNMADGYRKDMVYRD